jgi:hypothetical protein
MKVEPLKTYKTPEYPKKDLVDSNPDLLKKNLPALWLKEAAVAGALTVLLAGGLAEKNYIQNSASNNNLKATGIFNIADKASLIVPIFKHGSGLASSGCVAISPPCYLTEEEARLVIEDEFRKENIIFNEHDKKIEGIIILKGIQPENHNTLIQSPNIFEKKEVCEFSFDGFSTKDLIGYEFISLLSSKRTNDYSDIIDAKYTCTASVENVIGCAEYLSYQLKRSPKKVKTGIFYDPLPKQDEIPNQPLCSGEVRLEKSLDDYKKDYEKIKKVSKDHSKSLLRLQVQDYIKWAKEKGDIK